MDFKLKKEEELIITEANYKCNICGKTKEDNLSISCGDNFKLITHGTIPGAPCGYYGYCGYCNNRKINYIIVCKDCIKNLGKVVK